VSFSWADPTFHPVSFVLVLGLFAWYHETTSRSASSATRGQKRCFVLGLLALLLATIWPIVDLAHSVSLLVLVFQREILVLVAAPLLLIGLPKMVMARLTRPPIVDAVVTRIITPLRALVATTLLLGLTGLPFAVTWASESHFADAVMILLTLLAGFILWLPVVDRVPGVTPLGPLGKGAYLFAQSLAPTFLSFAWIFALRPLYPSLQHQQHVLGLTPLGDQQLSGYLAKLGTFGVLWIVAFVFFFKAPDEEPEENTKPLHWIDVERSLERAERREKRGYDERTLPG